MADRSTYPSEQADKFLLRLPDGLRERLKAAAEKNGRSMNAEIVQRLEDSFGGAMVLIPTDIRRRIDQAARTSRRDFGGELMSALLTLYPAPVQPEEDIKAFAQVSLRLLSEAPPSERRAMQDELTRLLSKGPFGEKVAREMLNATAAQRTFGEFYASEEGQELKRQLEALATERSKLETSGKVKNLPRPSGPSAGGPSAGRAQRKK